MPDRVNGCLGFDFVHIVSVTWGSPNSRCKVPDRVSTCLGFDLLRRDLGLNGIRTVLAAMT